MLSTVFPPVLWPPVIAAGIAAVVSVLAIVLTKEQKTSEFRQAWIDSLRQELSDYAALLRVWKSDSLIVKQLANNEAFLAAAQEQSVNLESLRIRVRMRLNREEHGLLLELIDSIYESKGDARTAWTDAGTAFRQFEDEAARVLKEEWKRVKRGEPPYVWTKRTAVAVALASLIVIVLLFGSLLPSGLANPSLRSSSEVAK